MRQYRIFYKRLGSRNFATLTPRVDANLYAKPEIEAAIAHIRDNPVVEGMAIRLNDEMFNIVAFTQDAEAPQAFRFEGE